MSRDISVTHAARQNRLLSNHHEDLIDFGVATTVRRLDRGDELVRHAGSPTRLRPSTASSSAIATAGSPTLIVVMPIARAGFRLIPRSSKNTHSGGSTPSSRHAIS